MQIIFNDIKFLESIYNLTKRNNEKNHSISVMMKLQDKNTLLHRNSKFENMKNNRHTNTHTKREKETIKCTGIVCRRAINNAIIIAI